MDKIFLRGMHLETLIGVYEWERQNRQSLVFNLEIGLKDTFKNNDEISETVHYGVVHERLRQHLHEQQFLLLESLANDVAQFLFQTFVEIAWIHLQIIKPGMLPNVQEVGVEIERYANAQE